MTQQETIKTYGTSCFGEFFQVSADWDSPKSYIDGLELVQVGDLWGSWHSALRTQILIRCRELDIDEMDNEIFNEICDSIENVKRVQNVTGQHSASAGLPISNEKFPVRGLQTADVGEEDGVSRLSGVAVV